MTRLSLALIASLAVAPAVLAADPPPAVEVEGQPLAANAERLLRTLDSLGAPLPADVGKALAKAIADKDAKKVQEALDGHVLFVVNINPESRAVRPRRACSRPAGRRLSSRSSTRAR
jgi:hypothetical protein